MSVVYTTKSSAIRQNGESQNGCYKKTKHAKFSEKRVFLTPDTFTYLYVSRGKKRSFFGKFGVLCFLVTTVLRFALSPYYRLNMVQYQTKIMELSAK